MKLPRDVEPFVIGLWRFRRAGEARLWCCTYSYRGRYYDAGGCATIEEVIKRLRRNR